MGLKEIIIGIVMVAVFILSLITFGSQLAVNNNADNNILNDPILSGLNKSLISNLSVVRSTAQSQRESLEGQEAQGDTIDEGFGLTAIVGSVWNFISLGVASLNLIFVALSDILGIPKLILNVIIGSILIVIVFFAWRVWKVGGT